MGLAFDTFAVSATELRLKSSWGNDTTLGRTPLSNIFAQNTSLQRLFDMTLGRSDDLSPANEGMLFVGVHAPGFDSVTQAPVLHNVAPGTWSAYIDAMSVNGRNIPLGQSILSTTPQGKLAALIDSGTNNVVLSQELANAIYESIPGTVSQPDGSLVPCAGAANVTFTIG